VLSGLTLRVAEGERVAVMGHSGCGKTTLLRLLLGHLRPTGGAVSGAAGLRFGVVFQEDRLCEPFSAASNARMALALPRKEGARLAARHLAELGLGGHEAVPVRELSGGMRRRVAIARAVLFGGDALLLDEPFKGLDDESRAAAARYVLAHAGGARALILVTHDEAEAALLGARVVRLQ
jgi:NitT/TauT family transport system ATP-binding protein